MVDQFQQASGLILLFVTKPRGHWIINAAMPSDDQVVSFLKARGADDIRHVTASLLGHLESTRDLLRDWGNHPFICAAGLCHAVYGTAGFPTALLEVSRRNELTALIGAEAEALVYFYAACDRPHVYPQIGRTQFIEYRDRFTGETFAADDGMMRALLEVTFANELELARATPDTKRDVRSSLGDLFERSRSMVSNPAYAYFAELYGVSP